MLGVKIWKEIKEVWIQKLLLENSVVNKYGIFKNNIDSCIKTLIIIFKFVFKIFLLLFLIWFICGVSYYLYLNIQYHYEFTFFIKIKNLSIELSKNENLSNISMYITWLDFINEVLKLIDNILSIINQSLINQNLKNISYEHLNSYWNVFVNPLVKLTDGIFYIIIALTGIPLVKSLLFNFSTDNSLWNLPKIYWYGFLISLILVVFIILYQLLSVASKNNNNEKSARTKNIIFGTTLIFSSIIFIPILFWMINYLILFILNMIFSQFEINGTFSFSKMLFDLSFVSFENDSLMISNVPNTPYLLNTILSPDVFYHLLFLSGLFLVSYYEIKLLIFILARSFNILFLFISGPIVNSMFVYDGGEKMQIWFKKIFSEFFSITIIVLSFVILVSSFSIIMYSLKPLQEMAIENNYIYCAKLMNYSFVMILIITFFQSSTKFKEISNNLFFGQDIKISGQLKTETKNNTIQGKLNEKYDLNSISNSIKVNSEIMKKNLDNNIKIQQKKLYSQKNIDKQIEKIRKKGW